VPPAELSGVGVDASNRVKEIAMCQFELSPEEVVLIRELLDSGLRELRDEIRHTDSRSYREMLKEREALLQKLNTHVSEQALLTLS
jgi:hypothetical protein